ncbi:MAG: SUMF1/EgtB/PvdO family nonheme iron enzyme [Candidatus Sericytochromatia bacterium]|nr:SUMF1/EgtB/PvdO family nonheme iron enzyme [Candidatus Sericytochromatia bacterium]
MYHAGRPFNPTAQRPDYRPCPDCLRHSRGMGPHGPCQPACDGSPETRRQSRRCRPDWQHAASRHDCRAKVVETPWFENPTMRVCSACMPSTPTSQIATRGRRTGRALALLVLGCSAGPGDGTSVGPLQDFVENTGGDRRILARAKPTPPPKRRKPTPRPKVPRVTPGPAATAAPTPTPTAAPPPGTVFVPPGTFQMGSPLSEVGRSQSEIPHPVTLTYGYWMQATEMTQGSWQAVMGNNPSGFTGHAQRPVERVSWFDAVACANAMSIRDGLPPAYAIAGCSGTPGSGNYGCSSATLEAGTPDLAVGWRLPTEAEWEHAYRAGTTTPWYNGHDPARVVDVAWFGTGSPNLVGLKVPNAWGLYDLAGNLVEWVQDGPSTYPSVGVTNPRGPDNAARRIIRGGSCCWSGVYTVRAAARNDTWPGDRDTDIGFRLVRTAVNTGTPRTFAVQAAARDGSNFSVWQDSGIDLPSSGRVAFSASGLAWNDGPGGPGRGPEGVNIAIADALVPSLGVTALIGKVGATGTPFLIGAGRTLSLPSGRLFLAYNDSIASDNSGAFIVTVRTL